MSLHACQKWINKLKIEMLITFFFLSPHKPNGSQLPELNPVSVA